MLQSRRQQLRGPRPGGHVERHQRSIPVRRQPDENFVEHLIRDRPGNLARQIRPVGPGPLVAVRLHRIVMSAHPATAPADPIQRKRVQRRPRPHVAMKVVEGPQHRLAMRPHRRRIAGPDSRGHRVSGYLRVTPMRPPRLPRDLHPHSEIPGLRPRRLIPCHPYSPAEPQPPQQIHPIGPQRRRRPRSGLQLSQKRRHPRDGHPLGVQHLKRRPRITTGDQPSHLRDNHSGDIPARLRGLLHDRHV